jgi:hypothetical protein
MIKNRFKFLTKRSCRTKPITMRRAINLAISKVKRKIKKLSDSEKSLTTNMIKYSEK